MLIKEQSGEKEICGTLIQFATTNKPFSCWNVVSPSVWKTPYRDGVATLSSITLLCHCQLPPWEYNMLNCCRGNNMLVVNIILRQRGLLNQIASNRIMAWSDWCVHFGEDSIIFCVSNLKCPPRWRVSSPLNKGNLIILLRYPLTWLACQISLGN